MSSETIGAAVLAAIALVWLTALIGILLRQTFVLIPRATQELMELNSQRAQRAEEALAVGAPLNLGEASGEPIYPFSGWLNLSPDGKEVIIAGQHFSLHETFEATATDENNIPRARALCKGNGEILISSHGQLFVARFLNQAWEVKPISSS